MNTMESRVVPQQKRYTSNVLQEKTLSRQLM